MNNTQQFLQVAAQRMQEVKDDPNTKKILRFGTEQEKAMFQQAPGKYLHLENGALFIRFRRNEMSVAEAVMRLYRAVSVVGSLGWIVKL